MRVCKHGCGVKLFGFSSANHASTKLEKFSSSKLVSGLHNCFEFSLPLLVYIRLCKHGKCFLLLKCNSTTLHICLKILNLNLVGIVINFKLFGT